MRMFRRILLATDGSKCALRAAEFASDIAAKFESSLLIVAVFHPIPVVSPYGDGAYELEPEQIGEILDQAIRVTVPVPQSKNVRYSIRKEIGYPAEEIQRVAVEEDCDLIVLGSRGLSGLKSFLLGSVSDRVTHAAHCPVLIAR